MNDTDALAPQSESSEDDGPLALHFTIGTRVHTIDGVGGVVTRVVVDPIARSLTHLVVEPKHRKGLARLVPLDLVDAASRELRLNLSLSEFEELEPAEETYFLPGTFPGYRSEELFSWPYYGIGLGSLGLAGPGGMAPTVGGENAPQPVTTDAVPAGEVAVRRGDSVQATDGEIGRVQGLVVDARNSRVTHVLLEEGHLWGRREVAIPITAVSRVEDGIHLNLDKHEVEVLPPVDVNHPEG